MMQQSLHESKQTTACKRYDLLCNVPSTIFCFQNFLNLNLIRIFKTINRRSYETGSREDLSRMSGGPSIAAKLANIQHVRIPVTCRPLSVIVTVTPFF